MATDRSGEFTYPTEQLSPAQRYERSRDLARYPLLADFAAGKPFVLDEFQVQACRRLEDGHGVLVCAPTGAGKTVVGEFAVHRARTSGGKCFYTTPIKALSNQKFADLADLHGIENVGLLTGDVAVNSSAPVVVMTTEVLRNMLYAGSADLTGLTAVVMDEIHYLADRFRGAVWEEVILHLPESVQLIGLSATVSNAEEFGGWLQQVRGDTAVVVDEQRPVPLWQHMMVGRRMFDLFADGDSGSTRVDPSLQRAVQQAERRFSGSRAPAARGPVRHRGGRQARGYRGPGWRPPSRVDVIERLDGAGLLPAITFIFSRAGCDAAVTQCARSGLRLVTDAERERIRGVVDRRAAELPEADLGVLGFWEWREALERGVAAHHAGLLPAFKETVEELFVAGLVKAVFATETLALGINMPARTVVLERLVKYNGEGHVDLTPGEYTQLTGRAGRRGIDVEGHAVVLWSPGVDPRHVGGLASTRTYPLRSSFRPSYNMAVNLIDRLGRAAAMELLQTSFAQYQANASVVGVATQVQQGHRAVAAHETKMRCERGDVAEYGELLSELSSAEKERSRTRSARRRETVREDLARLRRGDVIDIPAGRRSGLAVVLDAGSEPDGSHRPLVVTAGRWAGRVQAADFHGPVPALGRIRLPKHVNHRSPQVRRDIASSIAASGVRPEPRRKSAERTRDDDAALTALRAAVRRHPVHDCPDRDDHLRWWRRRNQQRAESDTLQRRVAGARNSLSDRLEVILQLLADRGYLVGDRLTDRGRVLARIWSECDLLTAECLDEGLLVGLDPPELAAAVSTLVYESRRDDRPGPPRVPGPAGRAARDIHRMWVRLRTEERDRGLPPTREPDPGFAAAVRTWGSGGGLAAALEAGSAAGADLSAGDFVRWCRQVIDLLDQLAGVADDATAATADAAVRAVRRGVVALGAL